MCRNVWCQTVLEGGLAALTEAREDLVAVRALLMTDTEVFDLNTELLEFEYRTVFNLNTIDHHGGVQFEYRSFQTT